MKSFASLVSGCVALIILAASSLASSSALASDGLVIHATEFGVGKFHRYDNKVHPYPAGSAWAPYILANGASTDQPLTQKNSDGSFTIFFSTLDEMMNSVTVVAKNENKKISVLNVHGHGLPGAMWFPKDARALNSWGCADWVQAASGDDVDNYNQYYGAVSASEVQQIRQISNNPNVRMSCTTGANEWREGVAKLPAFKAALADDAQLHFASCVVGLGSVGEAFTKDIAEILLPQGPGRVETSIAFGLGDWSMPEGMGFWDYQSDAQIARDNASYSKNRVDREIAQKGAIRVASMSGAQWSTRVLADRDFMSLGFELNLLGTPVTELRSLPSRGSVPTRVRIPGTGAYAEVESR